MLHMHAGKEVSSWLNQNKGRYESSTPFLQRDQEDRPRQRESNIYASITLNGKTVHSTAHPDDVVIHYWNENYCAPPIKPSLASGSVSKQSSGDVEESMYLNPLYKESEST